MKATRLPSLRTLAICALTQLLCATFVTAQTYPFLPYPDSSFNNSGKASLSYIAKFIPQEQALQSDGKILVAGYGEDNASLNLDGFIYRLNSDGTLDESFGTGGFQRIDIDGTPDAVEGLSVFSNGNILILLVSNNRIVLVRLLPDGNYDLSFGNGGALYTEASVSEYGYEMRVQNDQKIVVVGYQIVSGSLNKGMLRRFNSDGSPDTSFGINGYVSVTIDPSKNLQLYDCAIQPDGKIVATGPYGTGATSGFPIIRLNTNGSLDNTFSGDGIYLKTIGTSMISAAAYCIAVRPDGMIFVGGTASNGVKSVMTVLSVNANGGANASFASFGEAKIPVHEYSNIYDIIIQPDGKLLLGGYCYFNPTSTGFVYARLLANGFKDPSFGMGGTSQGIFVGTLNEAFNVQVITDMDLQPDGRLVTMLWMNKTVNLAPSEPSKCVIFRYRTDILVNTFEPNSAIQAVSIFPNPVKNDLVTLEYKLNKSQSVSIFLCDINGKQVAALVNQEHRASGKNQEQFYLPSDLPPGIYFVVLSSKGGGRTMKIVKE